MTSSSRALLRGAASLGPALVVVILCEDCVSSHFAAVARAAAATREDYCGGVISVRPLNDWAYAVEACETTTYYRCFYKRRSGGRVQCCHPVPDRGAATTLVSFEPERDAHCVEFDH